MEKEKILVIHGSARKESDTHRFIQQVLQDTAHTLVHLSEHIIAPYNYVHNYPPEDNFYAVTELLLAHPKVIWATPVYWYAMSGLLKTFFDRFTDLVTINKKMGRQLEGKHTYLISVGADPALPAGFEIPFDLTARYLNMHYNGYLYHSTKHPAAAADMQQAIQAFTYKLKN